MNLDDSADRDDLQALLEEARRTLWRFMTPSGDGARLRLGDLRVAPLQRAWWCPTTRRLVDTTFRGFSPYDRSGVSGGFPNDDDRDRCIEFQDAGWQHRSDIVSRFNDPRLRAFGRRLVYSEHRSLLPEAERIAADIELAERLLLEQGGPLTLGKAPEETRALLADDIGDPTGWHLGPQLFARPSRPGKGISPGVWQRNSRRSAAKPGRLYRQDVRPRGLSRR